MLRRASIRIEPRGHVYREIRSENKEKRRLILGGGEQVYVTSSHDEAVTVDVLNTCLFQVPLVRMVRMVNVTSGVDVGRRAAENIPRQSCHLTTLILMSKGKKVQNGTVRQ